MYISYDYYRIFYYVGKYGNFTHAAKALMSNQPNVTRTMKALEKELGCTLFVRSKNGVKLTSEGESLYKHVVIAFEHLNAAEDEISTNKSFENGIISIGASEIALHCFLLPILDKFKTKYPGVRLKISNHSTPQAIAKLKTELVDFAIVTSPFDIDSDFTETKLKKFREVAICAEKFSSLTDKSKIEFDELLNFPIVSLGPKTSTYDFYVNEFRKNGVDFSVDVEAATADQILPLVEHNLGVGFVPEEFLTQNVTKDIHRLNLATPVSERSICLLKKRSLFLSPPARELERMILENADK